MAGEIVFSVTRKLSGAGLNAGGITYTFLADSVVPFQKDIPAGSIKIEADLAVTLTKAKAIGISSNQPCTIYTNDATTPIDTIPLLANQEIVWVRGVDPDAAIPFSADVTKVFISVPGATAAHVVILIPVDVTPVLA